MSTTRILILANSWKHKDWCVAGIDMATAKWIRPVSDLDDGRLQKRAMKTGGHFPQLRDIFDIPLGGAGQDFGFARENRRLLPGPWAWHGKAELDTLLPYAETPEFILHNPLKYVTLEEMAAKAPEDRATLQLIRSENFALRGRRSSENAQRQWQGVVYSGAGELVLNITDPVLSGRLEAGYRPSKSCLLTLSLSMPYRPPEWPEDSSSPCWKLIAGVIEI